MPFELGTLPQLKELNVSYNKFTGTVTSNIAMLDAMHMMMISNDGMATQLAIDDKP